MDKKTLLVIDDDRDQQLGLGVRLRSCGYNVAFASDCIQAISAVRKCRPDLILLDIGLPGGDGYLVLERIRNLGPSATIPILVLSARDRATHEPRALAAGAEAFFEKPVDNDELLAAIRTALHEDSDIAKAG